MGSIYINRREDLLHSPLPLHLCQCLSPTVHMPFFPEQVLHHFHGKQGISRLITSYIIQFPRGSSIISIRAGKSNMFVFDSKNFVRIFPDFFTGTSLLCCRLFNDSVTFFCTLCIKDRNTGTDDPGFLTGNLLHGIPQIFHVIQSNGSNHTHFRIFCGTGCIQPSAKSCLQDHILCFCLGKCQHSHSEQKFKKGRMLQSLRLHLLYRP